MMIIRSSNIQTDKRIISWFSCGAASAFATYLAKDKYKDRLLKLFTVERKSEDNMRFLED